MTTEEVNSGLLGGLPAADRTLLIDPPLEVAIAEVRFGTEKSEISSEEAFLFRAVLEAGGTAFPRMEPALQQQMQFDASSGLPPQVTTQSRGWQFVSFDSLVQVTLMPQMLTLQTSKYERWSTSVGSVLERLLGEVENLLQPSVTNRIGLRYVDKFVDRDVNDASGWRGRIDDSFLGPIIHSSLGSLVIGGQQQLDLQLDPTHGAVLRHGPFRDDSSGGSVSYLLDIDVYEARADRFDVRTVLDSAEQLNRTALALFQSAVSHDYLKAMQGSAK